MNIRRIRHARLRMRIMGRMRAFRYAVAGIRAIVAWTGWSQSSVRLAGLLLLLPMLWTIVSTPLDVGPQLALGVTCFLAAYIFRDLPGRYVTQVLIILSVTASTRYLYWRVTETMQFETWDNAFFGVGLFLAELYAWIVLILGFIQTAWPLERKPQALPKNTDKWPTVDVLIPTYNEPLSVVKNTVFAAMGMDWPKGKIKVYILDDGRRAEFRDFAEAAGVGYLTRDNNRHAKAGNINAALNHVSGEYVAIFDCDHIPTRAYLQISMGWFLKDEKLAMIQTPHHFFSPDPFEKNLGTFKSVPNEGELFYGLVQDGNDLWNATFFCGSCAVIQRAALDRVGGIATETVTEDAHTALKLHRLGYSTAYLAIPLAAGFATESLGGHVGQRIRWARGMAQIFRVDNPLLGKGLHLTQRLCYLNAMLHFFYGLPRLVFLTAPLAYLIFGSQVIQASAITIAVFVLPHLLHASLTNSRMQGEFRHSFWAEVYETVLAWYILRPTLVAVVNPKLGKFNVTDKGGMNASTHFDWDMARPYMFLMLLGLAGVVGGVVRLVWMPDVAYDTLALNLLWTVYNLLMLGVSTAVANEAKQVRSSPRVSMVLQASLRCESGNSYACTTTDYSDGGVGIRLSTAIDLNHGDRVWLALFRGDEEYEFEAEISLIRGQMLGLKLLPMSSQQSVDFVQATFARADSWVVWGDKRKMDKPLASLRQISMMGVLGIGLLVKLLRDNVRQQWFPSLKRQQVKKAAASVN